MAQKLLPAGAAVYRQATTAKATLLRASPSLSANLLNQSSLAATQPQKDIPAIRFGDNFSLAKCFSKQDLVNYSKMTLNANPIHWDEEFAKTTLFGKPTVHESLLYSATSGCANEYMQSKGISGVILQCFNQHPEPLYVGEEVHVGLAVTERDGRKVTLEIVSAEKLSGRVVCRVELDCRIPRGSPE